jgi:hypothetical protein
MPDPRVLTWHQEPGSAPAQTTAILQVVLMEPIVLDPTKLVGVSPISRALRECASRMLLLCSMLALPLSAAANRYPCTGMVEQVTTPPGGVVNVTLAFSSGRMEWQDLCSVAVEANGVAPASCRAMLAALLTAQASGRRVTMWFDHPSQSCSATPWTSIREKGWYWGPAVVPLIGNGIRGNSVCGGVLLGLEQRKNRAITCSLGDCRIETTSRLSCLS